MNYKLYELYLNKADFFKRKKSVPSPNSFSSCDLRFTHKDGTPPKRNMPKIEPIQRSE